MTRDEIAERIIGLVADSLALEPHEVSLHDSLSDDLDAESIDFLDLQFRIEGEFGLQIPEDELYRGSLDFTDPRWLAEGRVTEEGLARLHALQPGFAWERFPDGLAERDLPRLVTVQTVVDYVARRLEGLEGGDR